MIARLTIPPNYTQMYLTKEASILLDAHERKVISLIEKPDGLYFGFFTAYGSAVITLEKHNNCFRICAMTMAKYICNYYADQRFFQIQPPQEIDGKQLFKITPIQNEI